MINLKKMVDEQNPEIVKETREFNKMKEAYMKEARLKKYKYNMASRSNTHDQVTIFHALGEYPNSLWLEKCNDKIFYNYKRKLKR